MMLSVHDKRCVSEHNNNFGQVVKHSLNWPLAGPFESRLLFFLRTRNSRGVAGSLADLLQIGI